MPDDLDDLRVVFENYIIDLGRHPKGEFKYEELQSFAIDFARTAIASAVKSERERVGVVFQRVCDTHLQQAQPRGAIIGNVVHGCELCDVLNELYAVI